MMTSKWLFTITAGLTLLSPAAHATYSIVACDPMTHACGVAVQTNNLAVGASVPYAKAGVGAIASQFETNPVYGPRGLDLLAHGKSPKATLEQLLTEDGNFDGEGIDARQVGIVSVDGRAFAYTGQQAANSPWAGSRTGKGYSIQGNGLAGPQVVEAMEHAFLNTTGPLPDRLMAALVAGDHAGGQTTGRESAALLVRTSAGGFADTDLRVDHSANPVADLRVLLNIQTARQQIVQARIAAGKGQFEAAKTLLINGTSLAPQWPRVWTQAAQVANNIGEPELAVQYLNIVFTMNAAWVETEIGEGTYASLGADPLFHRWVTTEQQNAALSDYRQLTTSGNPFANSRIQIANKLLEAGKPEEALASVATLTANADVLLIRAYASAAQGKYQQAIQQCSTAPGKSQKTLLLQLQCASWKTAMSITDKVK